MQKVVKNKDGRDVTVAANTEEELNDAVKSVQNDSAPVYPNINHPVEKGHDLVATGSDLSSVLVDGTGAHNSPNNAVKPFNDKTDSDVKVEGLDEPAYKQVPVSDNDTADLRVASDKEVAAAKKEADKNEQ